MSSRKSTFTLLVIFSILLLFSCNRQTALQSTFTLDIVQEPPQSIWVINAGDNAEIFQFPAGKSIYLGKSDKLLAYWKNGIIRKTEASAEWLDLSVSTGEYAVNPAIELTSRDIPIAVDPDNNVLYAFGHALAPSRLIFAHYLDGREPVQTGQLVADEVETLTPLPSNGWPVFYVDRPSQAGAVTIDNSPTRKMRVYSGRSIGGEFPDVKEVYFLPDNVILNREEGWFLFEAARESVHQRTMSLGQIPGTPRPMARVGDNILIASDENADNASAQASSKLYTYGAYTRIVDEIWDAGSVGNALKILYVSVIGQDDYLVILAMLPDMKKLMLGRLVNGRWTECATVSLNDTVKQTAVFTLEEQSDTELQTMEPVQESEVSGEDGISPEGSVSQDETGNIS